MIDIKANDEAVKAIALKQAAITEIQGKIDNLYVHKGDLIEEMENVRSTYILKEKVLREYRWVIAKVRIGGRIVLKCLEPKRFLMGLGEVIQCKPGDWWTIYLDADKRVSLRGEDQNVFLTIYEGEDKSIPAWLAELDLDMATDALSHEILDLKVKLYEMEALQDQCNRPLPEKTECITIQSTAWRCVLSNFNPDTMECDFEMLTPVRVKGRGTYRDNYGMRFIEIPRGTECSRVMSDYYGSKDRDWQITLTFENAAAVLYALGRTPEGEKYKWNLITSTLQGSTECALSAKPCGTEYASLRVEYG